MRKRSGTPDESNRRASFLKEEHIYSADQIQIIIDNVGLRLPSGRIEIVRQNPQTRNYDIRVRVNRVEALRSRLDDAARHFAWEHILQAKPASSHVRKQLMTIASASTRISTTLTNALQEEVPPNSVFTLRQVLWRQIILTPADMPGLSSGRLADWQSFARAMEVLAQGAVKAASTLVVKKGRSGRDKRNKGDAALRKVVGNLAAIYEEIWKREVGVARIAETHIATHDAGGPAVRFIRAALDVLGIALTGESIAAHLRRYSQN